MNIEWIDAFRGWLNTGILGAILVFIGRLGPQYLKHLRERNAQRMQEKVEDRQGYGPLIEVLNKQVAEQQKTITAQADRITAIEAARDLDHALIVALMRQMSAQQIATILTSNPDAVSPAIRRMFESLATAPLSPPEPA